jgi:hypothetical protein
VDGDPDRPDTGDDEPWTAHVHFDRPMTQEEALADPDEDDDDDDDDD